MNTSSFEKKTAPQMQQKHPIGFWFVSVLQIFERLSYYGMRGLLMLYLTTEAIKGGLGLDRTSAATIYANFTMFVYFAPLLGGYISDRFLGKRKTFLIGSFFIVAGMIALFNATGKPSVLIALALIIIGNGCWKPNITSVVGDFYDNNDPRKDGAYSIHYTFVNVGAFLAPLICGTLAEKTFAVTKGTEIISYGYKYGFLVAGLSMLCGTILILILGSKLMNGIGSAPIKKQSSPSNTKKSKTPLSRSERKRVYAILGLAFFVIIFWAGFEQAGSSLTLYTNEYINRDISGFEVPTSWFQSINPLLCIILGPIFAWWFLKLSQSQKGDIPTPKKMGYGLIVLGAGFGLMALAALERGNAIDPNIKANIIWLFGAYFLHTVGEMFLSPVGLSMVSKLSPKQIAALMMGVWFFATGFGNYIAGMSAALLETWGGLQVFLFVTAITVSAGILLCLLNPLFEKLMSLKDIDLEEQVS